jgi:hypothetical protein
MPLRHAAPLCSIGKTNVFAFVGGCRIQLWLVKLSL